MSAKRIIITVFEMKTEVTRFCFLNLLNAVFIVIFYLHNRYEMSRFPMSRLAAARSQVSVASMVMSWRNPKYLARLITLMSWQLCLGKCFRHRKPVLTSSLHVTKHATVMLLSQWYRGWYDATQINITNARRAEAWPALRGRLYWSLASLWPHQQCD